MACSRQRLHSACFSSRNVSSKTNFENTRNVDNLIFPFAEVWAARRFQRYEEEEEEYDEEYEEEEEEEEADDAYRLLASARTLSKLSG